MTEDLRSLFTRDGSLLVPTAAALGPWRPDALHGGAVSALLGHSLEERGWQLARVTMDLVRRVPLEPLRLTAEATARSRGVMRKEATLWAGDLLVAKAAALLLPEAEVELSHQLNRILELPGETEAQDPGEVRATMVRRIGYMSFVNHAAAIRNTRRNGADEGRVYWLNLLLPVIAGEPITPINASAPPLITPNGGFPSLPFEEWPFMSVDLTVQLTRQFRAKIK
jgi:Thioesterase-like superfamily